MANLSGKNAIVTGGTRGIGRAIAKSFLESGARVAIIGTNPEGVSKAVSELCAECGVPADAVAGRACDIKDTQAVQTAIDELVAGFGGKLDILVNNAGITRDNLVMRLPEADWDAVIDTNLKGVYNCIRACVRPMIRARSGRIVNISSIHSLMTQPGNMLYAGTKGAMNSASRAIALDYAKDHIRINTICPGVVVSDVFYDDMDRMTPEELTKFHDIVRRCQPLEPGRMQDIANTALFFASDMSTFITGQTLLVDGGTSIKAHDMDC